MIRPPPRHRTRSAHPRWRPRFPGAAGASPALSGALRPPRRAVSARRRHRRHRARRLRQAVGDLGPADGGREQGRRRDLDRHRYRRQGRPGRLHRAAAVDAARGEQISVRDLAVRSGGRSRAGQPDLRLPQRHGGADVVAGAFGAGVHRLRQGQSRQGQLCVVRARHLGASVRRAVQQDDGAEAPAHPLSRRRGRRSTISSPGAST